MADPVAMTVSYATLLEEVGEELFGITSAFSTDQTSKIERCMKHGLNRVYAAHNWSFFRPVEEITTTAPYSTGTVDIASGVVTLSAAGTFPAWAAVGVLLIDNEYYDVDTRGGDNEITLEDTSFTKACTLDGGEYYDDDTGVIASYELGRPEYDLPTTFEAIEGDLTYEPGQSDFYPPVRQKHDGEIRRLCQDDPYHDRPLYYGIRTVEFVPTTGSRRRLALYPTPDAAYVLKARMQLRATMIDATNLYPIGGEMLSQVITEACISAAELNYDETPGIHSRLFEELLPLAIQADLLVTSPTTLGPDAPKSENADFISRSVRCGNVSIDSVVM